MSSLGRHLLCMAHRRINYHCSRTHSYLFTNKYITKQMLPPTSVASRCYCTPPPPELPPYMGFIVDPTRDDSPVVNHHRIYNGADPSPIFMDGRVQDLLKRLTGCNTDKVFRQRKLRKRLSSPNYVFLTEEQLQEAREKSNLKLQQILQMPPVMKLQSDEIKVISNDPALDGLNETRIVFTDISFDISDRKRLIVVRETNGTLRHANSDERHRMNQIYNPKSGRNIKAPEMFQENRLKSALDRGLFEFVLDRTCAQLEPDDAVYQSVVAHAYDAVDTAKAYDHLLSSRHYGPMVFYFTWHRAIDNLLEDLVKKERLSAAGDVLRLHLLLHPNSSTAAAVPSDTENPVKLLKAYINAECQQRGPLELSLKMHQDLVRSREECEIKVAAAIGEDQQKGLE